MKKILSVLITVLLLTGIVPQLIFAAGTVNYTDFSVAEPTNWTLDGATIADGVMELGESSAWQLLKLPKIYPSGTVVVEYDFKSYSNKLNVYIQSPVKSSVCRMQQVNSTTLQLQHNKDDASGNENTVITNKQFSQGTWYHMKHIINYAKEPDNTTSSVYMYDIEGNLIASVENKVHMDAHQYNSAEDLRLIQVQNNGTEGKVYFDNFAVYENTDEAVMAINKLAIAVDNSELISDDLLLNTVGYGGAVISWSSSNENIIKPDGKVQLPSAPADVTLTATILYNGKTETVSYPVTVASKGSHIVKADVYAYDFNDNTAFPGIETKATEGYNGIRNGRIELERPDDVEIKVTPQVIMDFTDMEYKSFAGKMIMEFDFIADSDKGAKVYVQAAPNGGSLLRFEQKVNGIQITTGGTEETAVNTLSAYSAFAKGKWHHVKFILDYETQKCSVYINDTAVAEEHNFMNSVSPGALNTVHTLHDGTEGTFAIDNFVLYHTDADSSIVATSKMIDFIDMTEIADDIYLPTVGCNGAQIVWSSSDTNILANDGTLLVNPENDTAITLTAVISKDGYAMSKTVPVTVKGITPTDGINVNGPVIFDNVENVAVNTCAEGAVVISYGISKPSTSELAASIIAVVYDAENNIEKMYTVSDTVAKSRTYDEIKLELPEITQDGGKLDLFLWDSISGLKPLAVSHSYAISVE